MHLHLPGLLFPFLSCLVLPPAASSCCLHLPLPSSACFATSTTRTRPQADTPNHTQIHQNRPELSTVFSMCITVCCTARRAHARVGIACRVVREEAVGGGGCRSTLTQGACICRARVRGGARVGTWHYCGQRCCRRHLSLRGCSCVSCTTRILAPRAPWVATLQGVSAPLTPSS